MEEQFQDSPVQTSSGAGILQSPRLYYIVLSAILLVYIVLHIGAGNTMPVPWLDEAHFIWQAEGFAEHGSLFSPELNGDRTIFWMPPGYMVILGVVLKVFGLSLGVARTFSLLNMLGVIALLAAMARRYGHPLLAAVPIALFLLAGPSIAAGNVARMDAMLLLFVIGGFYCFQRGRIVYGIGLLALSPLIHPNGAFFLATGAVVGIVLLIKREKWERPTRGETIFLGAVILAWAAYGLYVGLHWQDFLQDMSLQFHRKLSRPYWQELFLARSKGLLIATSLASIYCVVKKLPALLLVALGAPAWWIGSAGGEMWYGVFSSLAYCTALLFFVFVARQMIVDRVWTKFRTILLLIIPVYAGFVLGWNLRYVAKPEAFFLADTRPWNGMNASPLPYASSEDLSKVSDLLKQRLSTSRPVSIQFFPDADAFFYAKLRSADVTFSCPLFYARHPNWYLFHLSSRTPQLLGRLGAITLRDLGVHPADMPRYVIYARDTSDQWFLIPGDSALRHP